MTHPNSAKLLAPVQASNPDTSHTARLAPTLCVFATTTPGEELVMGTGQTLEEVHGVEAVNIQYSGANLTSGGN